MAERPILFTGPMVRAILAGKKTQTRRIAKEFAGRDDLDAILRRFPNQTGCFYGQPGDRLWVRETWAQNWNQLSDTRMDRSYVYRADGECRAVDNGIELPWRPSIHMPRTACRLLLGVASVRVERLQDISDEDARAEGCDPWNDLRGVPNVTVGERAHGYRRAFYERWKQINGPESWRANPWVWVIEFRQTGTDKREK